LTAECGLRISLMQSWLEQRQHLSRAAFIDEFQAGTNFYFLAHP
jgi:hypothetical protein